MDGWNPVDVATHIKAMTWKGVGKWGLGLC
jgi:hypothetical protein